jgi:hypothetical protein
MKKNIFLLLLLIVLGGLAWWLYQKQSPTTLSDKPLAQFSLEDTAAVTKFTIFDPISGKKAIVHRVDTSSLWTINDRYFARPEMVETLLKTLHLVKVKSDVPTKARENVMRDLMVSKKVEIFQGGDEPSRIYYVGHSTPEKTGTFMMMEIPGMGRSENPYIVHIEGNNGFLTPRFFAAEDEWRYTGLFRFPNLELSAVELMSFENPAKSHKITYSGGNNISLYLDPQGNGTFNLPLVPFDSLLVKDYLLLFKKVHFETYNNYLSPRSIDSLLHTQPAYRLSVTDNVGKKTWVDLFYKKAFNLEMPGPDGKPYPWDQEYYYAKAPSGEVALAQRYVFDPLINLFP